MNKPLGLIQVQSSDPMAPGYVPIFQSDWTPDIPAQGATQDQTAWNKSIAAKMASDNVETAAPKQTGLNPGPSTWQQFSTWCTAHQTELAIFAGGLLLIILLTQYSKHVDWDDE